MRNLPPVVRNLLIINFIIYFATTIIGDAMYEYFALFPVASPFFHWWQFITHLFVHGGFAHVFFNMWALFMFGPVLEQMWGGKKFLLFYFICGLGAAGCHEIVQALSGTALNVPTVGASGAIYGVMLGFAMLYPDSVLTLIFPPISLKAKWWLVIYAVIELATGIFATSDGVAHFAHLGGMLFGLIMILWWKRGGKLYNEW